MNNLSLNSNFQFLEHEYPILANIATSAEYNCFTDPVTTLFKVRQFGEFLVEAVYHEHGLEMPGDNSFHHKLKTLEFEGILPDRVKDLVRRVESLFAKAANIEEKYQQLKQKIDNLPQAILAKAFKGELVEQLPTDGNAQDLLEEIKKLKATNTKQPPTKAKKYTQIKAAPGQAAEPKPGYAKKKTK